MKDKILGFINDNDLSSSDVADALGRAGHVRWVRPLNRGFRAVGEVEYLFAWYGSTWHTHKDLAAVAPNRILYIDDHCCEMRAVLGHLMAEYAFTHKKALALVVNGNIRDVEKMGNMPIWHRGASPVVCQKRKPIDEPDVDLERRKYQGGVMVCDDTGCTLIPPYLLTEQTLANLFVIRDREADWYSRMQRGESTFDITCD